MSITEFSQMLRGWGVGVVVVAGIGVIPNTGEIHTGALREAPWRPGEDLIFHPEACVLTTERQLEYTKT
jgi:hypothetical protein